MAMLRTMGIARSILITFWLIVATYIVHYDYYRSAVVPQFNRLVPEQAVLPHFNKLIPEQAVVPQFNRFVPEQPPPLLQDPKRGLAMTCGSSPGAHHPKNLGWRHSAKDSFLGILTVAEELAKSAFQYPLYHISYKDESESIRRCNDLARKYSLGASTGEEQVLKLDVHCLVIEHNLIKGYGYAKFDAVAHLNNHTDLEQVLFLDCDTLPVVDLTGLYSMLETGGEWGADYWANTGDTSVSAGNHVSDNSPGLGAVFWADIEGHYTINTKLISAKQKELYSNEKSVGILKNAHDERVVAMDKSKLFTSTHMTVGCDTGIMLIDLRRSNVALELLNVIRNDEELLATSRGDKDIWRHAYFLSRTPFRIAPYVGALGHFSGKREFTFTSQPKHDDKGDIVLVHQIWAPRADHMDRHRINIKALDAEGEGALSEPNAIKIPFLRPYYNTFDGHRWKKLDPEPTKHHSARTHIRILVNERPDYVDLYMSKTWKKYSTELSPKEMMATPTDVLEKLYRLPGKYDFL